MGETVVIAGSLAQKPGQGGHTWQFMQYVLGFKRLGWDVLFLDRLEPEMCFDEAGHRCEVEDSVNFRYFFDVMRGFDLDGSFSLICGPHRQFAGLSRQQVLERVRNAAFLFNVMGFLTDEEILASARRRVFLDTDPGFGQMWRDLGLADIFSGHDDFVTIAENILEPDCAIPACGLRWITWRQPIVLDRWNATYKESGDFTGIGFWRGPYSSLEYRGKTYGLRAHEFRKFAAIPRLSGRSFQFAFDIDSAEVRDLKLLRENGWILVNPRTIARDPWVYQKYLADSMAEFMVAKNMYVETRCGWFSERSICYLASGKPVLAQDTGIRGIYPSREGLLIYSTLEDALAGVEEISRDYMRHARAARSIAEEYFESDRIINTLLDKLGTD